ncbi:hypothetical protein Rcae01_04776 [Novipirellula caenicola]|uniref:Uncharacterized protein n=1 Tax=Novipirellula caenicola TaxID=1536901 RepID=A0ABP9VVW1_9BACT
MRLFFWPNHAQKCQSGSFSGDQNKSLQTGCTGDEARISGDCVPPHESCPSRIVAVTNRLCHEFVSLQPDRDPANVTMIYRDETLGDALQRRQTWFRWIRSRLGRQRANQRLGRRFDRDPGSSVLGKHFGKLSFVTPGTQIDIDRQRS